MIFRFEDPWVLLLLGVVPALAWWYAKGARRRRGSLTHPDAEGLARAAGSGGQWPSHLPVALRGLALVCLIVAFARPQTGVTGENVVAEGIDIVLALDISSSMLAEDLAPNRIEASKAVAADFVAGRRNDRLGVVIFAGRAFTQAPLTLDHSVVTSLIAELEVGMIEDGTAVGMGLATAVKRLQASEAPSKVVILLTDGRNNRGEIAPVTAAQAAQALGVRVYTVGAGARGTARVPIPDPFGGQRYVTTRVDVDEAGLRTVAETTGGALLPARPTARVWRRSTRRSISWRPPRCSSRTSQRTGSASPCRCPWDCSSCWPRRSWGAPG